MDIKTLPDIKFHTTDKHADHKSDYSHSIQYYVKYKQTHFIERDLMKKYHEVFLHCDICAEYYEYYCAHSAVIAGESEKPKAVKKLPELEKGSIIEQLQYAFPDIVPVKRNIIDTTLQVAAAGSDISLWFKEPVYFKGAGIKLDVREIKSKKQQVSIYLSPYQSDKTSSPTAEELSIIKNTLGEYAGKDIGVVILRDNKPLLEAVIYISEDADKGSGSGTLVAKDNGIGILQLEVIVD